MTEQPHLQAVHARFSAGGEETIDNGPTPPGGGSSPTSRASKARPERPIPTDRLKFENQLEILKQVASLSGNNRRGVTADTMSAAIGLKGNTGGLNSRFFRAAGWFEAVGRGEYTASAGLLSYARHINVDPDAHHEATKAMREEVRASWFWEIVGPMLEGGQPVRTKAILLELANAANASNHTSQLETIIEWLEWVDLVRRDGDTIQRFDVVKADGDRAEDCQIDSGVAHEDAKVDGGLGVGEPSSGSDGTSDQSNEPLVSFNMSVRLTADDVRSLSEDQMAFLMEFAEKLRG